MKKFVKVLFVLVFVMLCFTGCAKVEQFFIITPEGQIQSGLEVNLDKDKIDKVHNESLLTDKVSPTSAELMTFILLQMHLYKVNSIEKKLNAVDEALRPKYNVEIICDGQNYNLVDWNATDNARFILTFETYEDYLKGQAILNPNSGEDDKEDSGADFWTKDLFTYKHYIKSDSSFRASLLLTGEDSLVEFLKQNFSSFDIKEDVTFVQVFATKDKKLRSNATRTYSRKGVYYHTWQYNSEQVETSNSITMYYVYPNSQGWYLLTIILTFVFLIFYVLYVLYKTPLKNKIKKSEDIDKIINKKTDN